jgi:2-keto-3-deoxy-6-phosphogluconate aldolase
MCQTALLSARLLFRARVAEIISTVHQLDVIRHASARKRLVIIASGTITTNQQHHEQQSHQQPQHEGRLAAGD